jgi:hypothetical protein
MDAVERELAIEEQLRLRRVQDMMEQAKRQENRMAKELEVEERERRIRDRLSRERDDLILQDARERGLEFASGVDEARRLLRVQEMVEEAKRQENRVAKELEVEERERRIRDQLLRQRDALGHPHRRGGTKKKRHAKKTRRSKAKRM